MAQAKKINDSDAQPASISGRVDPYKSVPGVGRALPAAGMAKTSAPKYGIGKPALSKKPAGGPLSAYLKRTRGK
jgi:hypothetical protein